MPNLKTPKPLPKWLVALIEEIELIPGTIEFSIEQTEESKEDERKGPQVFRELEIKIIGKIFAHE